MRKIKFRAKRSDDGKWVFGDLTHEYRITRDKDIPCIRVARYNIDESSIGQFTGITDKNGKDIYEGVIMNDPTSMCVGVVEWNSILCQFQLSWQNMHTAADLFFMVKCGSFVIGNIHDNPEMRKGGAK